MVSDRFLCVSVDLDGLECYHDIHGLGDPDPQERDHHYTLGASRFLDLMDRLGIRATLFCVGKDLDRPACAAIVRRAHDAGHEIANHTQDHPYGFTLLDARAMRSQIEKCADAIFSTVGCRPVGFRAPGYLVDERVFEVLASMGLRWDSSILPSLPYVMAKVGVMAAMRLRGRRSRAVAGGAAMAVAPGLPYRTGSPWWRPGRGLPEFPCTVLPVLRLPFIGTSIALAGESVSAVAARLVATRRFIGLEFHAIDFLDAETDGLDRLASFQPDLRVKLLRKQSIFRRVLESLLDSGFDPVTLSTAAGRLFPVR